MLSKKPKLVYYIQGVIIFCKLYYLQLFRSNAAEIFVVVDGVRRRGDVEKVKLPQRSTRLPSLIKEAEELFWFHAFFLHFIFYQKYINKKQLTIKEVILHISINKYLHC